MKVELVAKTIGVGKYKELNDEEIIAAIARHGEIKEDNGKLVKYLMDNAHWSPLDMINYTFEIHTSLSIGRQLLRHSSIKPQEYSGRYAELPGFEKIEIRKEDTKNRQSSTEVFDPIIGGMKASERVQMVLNMCENIYRDLIEAGVAKECARMILPNCTTTKLTFNGTLRSWLSLLNVRCDHHAQKECQQTATLVGEELEKHLPKVMSKIDWRKGMFM